MLILGYAPADVNLDDSFYPTAEEAEFAASVFGPISDARDAAGPDELAEPGRHLDEQEEFDPSTFDADADDLADRFEQQELAQIGISGPNRGFWGHMA